jgi:hypothetical protein
MSYFADVELSLRVTGMTLSLSHVGPNEIVVRDACEPIPRSDAQLYIRVDDHKTLQHIFLPNGIPGPHVPVMFL